MATSSIHPNKSSRLKPFSSQNYSNKSITLSSDHKKRNNQLDYSCLVDQTLRISNLRFLEGLLGIQRFIETLYREFEFA